MGSREQTGASAHQPVIPVRIVQVSGETILIPVDTPSQAKPNFGSKERVITPESQKRSTELCEIAVNLAEKLGETHSEIITIGVFGSVYAQKADGESDIDLLCTGEDETYNPPVRDQLVKTLEQSIRENYSDITKGVEVHVTCLPQAIIDDPEDERFAYTPEVREIIRGVKENNELLYNRTERGE